MPAKLDLDSLRLETDRLILRPTRWEDFDGWAAFMADEVASKHIGGAVPRAVAWRSMMCMAGAWYLGKPAMFSVIEKASGRWVGRLGPWMPEGWPGTEVGWGIAREYWGRGYAVEGATAAIDFAFAHFGWTDVVHAIAVENKNSQAVARKLGSRNRGPSQLPPPIDKIPVELWGQTREEWRARHR